MSNIFRSGKRRENEPSLLAQAIELECQAEILLNQKRDILDAHDESAPLDGTKIGFGRGVMATRLALGESRAAQRLLDMEGVEDIVRLRLDRGKSAYAFALNIVEEYARSETQIFHIPQCA